MNGPVLLQDWVTLRGTGWSSAGSFYPHRSAWLWLGNAQRCAVSVEIPQFTLMTGGTTLPTFKIETAASEEGPWQVVKAYTAVPAGGVDRLVLLREPGGSTDQTMLGYLRWAIVETVSGGPWAITFRVVTVVEGVE